MSVHDAAPRDIYVDEQGKLWRCVMTCHEPTVSFEEIEPERMPYPDRLISGKEAADIDKANQLAVKRRVGGGVSGLMWNGWKRIYRPD